MTRPPPGAEPIGRTTAGRATLTVPEAAQLLGIGRDAAYRAAGRGEIPTLRLGRRILVPVAALERMLGVQQGQDSACFEPVDASSPDQPHSEQESRMT